MRTDGFCWPPTLIWATPRNLADVLHQHVFGVVVDRGQRQAVGVNAQGPESASRPGSLCDSCGGDGRFFGNWPPAALIAAWMSPAAPSMLRPRSNCTVIELVPRTLDDVSCVTPGIRANCFSSGVVTDDAMVTGSAPGSCVVTWMVGKSTCGKRCHRQQRVRHCANHQDPRHQQRGCDRAANEGGGNCHGSPQVRLAVTAVRAVGSTRLPGRRRYCPETTICVPACEALVRRPICHRSSARR